MKQNALLYSTGNMSDMLKTAIILGCFTKLENPINHNSLAIELNLEKIKKELKKVEVETVIVVSEIRLRSIPFVIDLIKSLKDSPCKFLCSFTLGVRLEELPDSIKSELSEMFLTIKAIGSNDNHIEIISELTS